jgi:hypothetical protein
MIPIYKYEKDAGLGEIIQASASMAYTVSINNITLDPHELHDINRLLLSSAMANPDQFDLFYLESILASVGWNQNDDVFDRLETWAARKTPVDKQFNLMHNEKDIIGHLTSSRVVDFDGGTIPDTILVDQLPEKFDIVVGAVLYRTWSDPDLQKRMNTLIEEITAGGKWCVSMECLFRNFDYAVMDSTGINKVLARNEQTAFLTKHLRVYGGTGEYDGYRIGRLLRNYTFSGKGLVDRPANPRSNITNFNEKTEPSSFVAAATTLEELNISKEEILMANEIVVYTKEQYDALKAELDTLKSASQQATKKEIDELKAEIAELTTQNQALSTELEASKEVSEAKATNVSALETELAEVKAKLAQAEDAIKQSEIQAVNAARKALLLARVDEAKADLLVEKFANASQEMFDALVDSLPVKAADDTEAKCGDKKKDESEAKCDEETEDKKEEDSCAEVKSDLDDAKATADASMSTGGTQEEETLRSKASAWFSQNVLRSTHKNN